MRKPDTLKKSVCNFPSHLGLFQRMGLPELAVGGYSLLPLICAS